MTKPVFHPWLSTPAAVRACLAAVRVAEKNLPAAARVLGPDEMFSEALMILTECALPPRERGHVACTQCGKSLEDVRAGAKFCSPGCRMTHANARRGTEAGKLPAVPKGYVGSMHAWPENRRDSYAAREVGLALCNYLRTQAARRERPNSPGIECASIPATGGDPEASAIDGEYARALDAFERTGEIPWRLIDAGKIQDLLTEMVDLAAGHQEDWACVAGKAA